MTAAHENCGRGDALLEACRNENRLSRNDRGLDQGRTRSGAAGQCSPARSFRRRRRTRAKADLASAAFDRRLFQATHRRGRARRARRFGQSRRLRRLAGENVRRPGGELNRTSRRHALGAARASAGPGSGGGAPAHGRLHPNHRPQDRRHHPSGHRRLRPRSTPHSGCAEAAPARRPRRALRRQCRRRRHRRCDCRPRSQTHPHDRRLQDLHHPGDFGERQFRARLGAGLHRRRHRLARQSASLGRARRNTCSNSGIGWAGATHCGRA